MIELPEHALQSAVVGVALDSNEKMLVGAPTGAGKTNLDLLAIEQYSVAVALSTTLSDAEEALATASVQVSSVSLPALSRIVMDV
jgi:Rad3-related DNA helicase